MPEPETNLPYFSHPETVLEYARAAVRVGLWRSEAALLERFVPKSARVLELGAGAGRVSVGMAKAGWGDLLATDFSPMMVDSALVVVSMAGVGDRVRCEVADATALPYADGSFDAAVFAFNGLLMIPGPGRREQAMREVARVLRPGGVFIFSGHDRSATRRDYWEETTRLWAKGVREAGADRLGDTLYDTPHGRIFIHSAAEDELASELDAVGMDIVFSRMRSEVAEEPREVTEFSDDTRLRVCVRR
jgi:SAM-dependent methyltransferase